MNCLRIFQLYGAVLSVKISFTNLLEIIENNSIYVRCILAKNLFDWDLSCMPTQSQTVNFRVLDGLAQFWLGGKAHCAFDGQGSRWRHFLR